MPLTKKGKEILTSMQEEYGEEKGNQVFYASVNAGTITGAERKRRHVSKHRARITPERPRIRK